MKSISILMCSALIGLLTACASTPASQSGNSSIAQAQGVPPGCVASTGTRLQRKSGDCAGSGRVWTQDELRRTGAFDPGQGLSLLDPSVTSH